jgi:hypothetical protein
VAEELRRLRAEMSAANPELTDADWDALAERLGDEVKVRLAERVGPSRGQDVERADAATSVGIAVSIRPYGVSSP